MTTNQKLLMISIVFLYILSHTILLTEYPTVSNDEPWNSASTYSHIKEGVFKNPYFLRLGYARRHDKSFEIFFVNKYALYPVYYFFGTGLVQGRLCMVFFGLITLFYTYKLARHLYDINIAIFATLLLTLDSLFIYTTRTNRFEPLGTAFAVSSIYYYLLAHDTNRMSYSLMAGLLCGITVFNHPVGIFLPIVIVAITIQLERKAFLKSKYLWLTGATAFLTFTPYFFTNTLADIGKYSQLLSTYNTLNFKGNNPILYGLWMELVSLKNFYLPFKPISGAIFLITYIWSLVTKETRIKTLALIISIFFLWSLILPPYSRHYYVYLCPYLSILIAYAFYRIYNNILISPKQINYVRILSVIFISLYISNHVLYTSAVLYRNRHYNYMGLEKHFARIPFKYNHVLSDYTWWFHLKDRDFIETNSLFYDGFDSIHNFKPHVVVISKFTLNGFQGEDKKLKMYKLMKYIRDNEGILFEEIETPYYGPIEIFLLDKNL